MCMYSMSVKRVLELVDLIERVPLPVFLLLVCVSRSRLVGASLHSTQ